MAAGPREARRETKDLVVLGTQHILALPAVHARTDRRRLLVDVEQHVLAAQVGRVDELETQLARRANAHVRYEAKPVSANAHANIDGLNVASFDTYQITVTRCLNRPSFLQSPEDASLQPLLCSAREVTVVII